ncbi:helix-turn-helix domain-containing protein [Microbulbifer sp.]|uniref:helix-turn-helix transcriptional regulator n=1 Tax=Microbulbifer sp. TaxID=1908541 RepID=UPI0025866CBD|nr:helix-turn-helix domain-containing protein [Microbulbifer sp.]
MSLTAQQRQALLIKLLTQYMLGELSQGQLLQYLRKEILNFNQTQYAEFVGVSRRTLSDLERDKGSPANTVINKVFKPFGLQAGLIPIHPHVAQKILAVPQE